MLTRLLPGVLLGVLFGCAKIEAPPGAPPDAVPPHLVSATPESLAVLPGFTGDVVFRFDEVISEGSSPNQGTGTGDLERLIIVSPTTRPADVRWRRDHITVRPKEGWQPNRVYRVQLLPGVVDLRNNRQTSGGTVVTFTTGAAKPTLTLTGSVQDWVTGRPAAAALVEAIHRPDSLTYRMLTDSAGNFTLGPIPDGEYLVVGTLDQSHNMQRDPREAFDSTHLAAGQSAVPTLWMFPHDTVGPRIRTITVGDSTSATIAFSQPLDPAQHLAPAAASVRLLPDSTPVTVASLLPPAADDSAFSRRPADTTGAHPPVAPVNPVNPPVKAPADTAARPGRPALSDRLVIRISGRWAPGARYVITLHGIRNVNGVAADATAGLAVPAAPPPAPTPATPVAPTPVAPTPAAPDSGARATPPR